MAWIKTEAGKREMRTRSLVSVRTQRLLLVLIDGRSSVQDLCAKITGASEADVQALREAGMIEWVGGMRQTPQTPQPASAAHAGASAPPGASSTLTAVPAVSSTLELDPPPATPSDSALAESSTSLQGPSYSHLSATLTRLVSTELGLRGLPLTLSVERAQSIDDLRRVAEVVVARIRERRGDASAQAARLALFGA